jgi:molybdopterin-guanine dinucleotide biosynthesis protein A
MGSRRNILVGVLAGGQSARMGRDKALLPHPSGGTFLEHIVSVAQSVTPDVALLGAPRLVPDSLGGLPVLTDARAGCGPLAGLCSALAAASSRWVVLLSCDLPMLAPRLLEKLLCYRLPDVDAAAFACGSEPSLLHACCALYHPRILTVAQRELFSGRASLQRLLRCVRTVEIAPEAEDKRQLSNVNTPTEFAHLSRAWRQLVTRAQDQSPDRALCKAASTASAIAEADDD